MELIRMAIVYPHLIACCVAIGLVLSSDIAMVKQLLKGDSSAHHEDNEMSAIQKNGFVGADCAVGYRYRHHFTRCIGQGMVLFCKSKIAGQNRHSGAFDHQWLHPAQHRNAGNAKSGLSAQPAI